jgi:membrane associated rhomboid family serine protease
VKTDVNRTQNKFYWIGILLLTMWLIRFVDATIPFDLTQFGLRPRRLWGVPGIMLMPLLHASFGHLLSNTFWLVILLSLTISSQRSPWRATVLTSLSGAALLWLFGRNAVHVGASGLVFGLVGLLIVSGLLERRLVPVGIAILVGILFGGTLISGIVPIGSGSVSWEGHLCGLLGGVATAFLLTPRAR